ncbi:MAG: D-glycero-alpha-D-manno-heptose-1,7-bisphosphate 7-phosphatase, partial [Bacteroidota bacterium]
MNKAVFLDRDGVINNDTGHYYVYKPADLEINEGVTEFLKILQSKGYKLIVISNQGGIAKKMYNHEDVEKIHDILKLKLEKEGITLDEIYYCPHHPDSENCICRKPESLMVETGMARFNVNKKEAFFIGDR